MSIKQDLPCSDEIKELLKIKNILTDENIIYKWSDRPLVRLYYVTMAKEHSSQTQNALAEQFKNDILKLNIYKEPRVSFITRNELKSIIDSNERNFEQVINFRSNMPLTEVGDVHNSCVLLCYANELKKLLLTPDGLIRKSLFDDNVRDFQGNTAINTAISETVKSEPEKFALLNNGITIVCDKYVQSNMSINIKNPQIVKGCQTSHVLFFNDEDRLSKTPVIIKLISTGNIEITNQIVRGTNNQNIVYREAFETTRPFHKDLEDFVNALSPEYGRFYYERRSKQYEHNPSIAYFQKINFRIFIQAFIAMFFNNPHIAYKHELKLLELFDGKVFTDQHSKYPYFTAALTFFKLESLYREEIIEKGKFRNFNMHLIMVFRELVGGDIPDINDTLKIEVYCKKILAVLKNAEAMKNYFKEAVHLFQDARNAWVKRGMSYDGVKDVKDFTELLLQFAKKDEKFILQDSVQDIYYGKIMRVGLDKHGYLYGFIRENSGDAIFFHSKRSQNIDFSNKAGSSVTFKKEFDPKKIITSQSM